MKNLKLINKADYIARIKEMKNVMWLEKEYKLNTDLRELRLILGVKYLSYIIINKDFWNQ